MRKVYILLQSLLILFLLGFVSEVSAQSSIPLPAHTSVYTGLARGYWFQAPSDFTLVGLRVASNAGTGNQAFQVVRFNSAPNTGCCSGPAFTTLHYSNGVTNGTVQSMNVSISSGDYIGILGTVNNTTNSYGSGPYTSNIDGNNMTLTRMGFQGSIASTAASSGSIWGVAGSGSIGRVELYYTTKQGFNNAGTNGIAAQPVYCAGSHPVLAVVQNYGKNQIDSVLVNWEVNGSAQTSVWLKNQLDTVGGAGKFRDTVNLGNITYAAGNSYEIKIWTSDPNGQNDTINFNDTSEVVTGTGLSGTYTIGDTAADFNGFAEATEALGAFGVCGAVTMNVDPNFTGTFNEHVELAEYAGVDATNTLTFNGGDPSIAHIKSGDLNVPIWNFNGADHVTVKNMTLEHENAAGGFGVLITGGAEYNTVDSNIIIVPVSTQSDVGGVIFSSSATSYTGAGNNGRFNVVSNNTIQNGYAAVSVEGNNTATPRGHGNQIINNTMDSPYLYGVFSDDQDSLLIHGNHVFGSVNAGSEGIYATDPGYIEIIGNQVQGNDHGIYIEDVNFTSSYRAKIINNMVIGGSDDGIEFDDIRNADVFHNTVVGGRSGVHFDDYQGIDVRNNVFGSTSGFDHAFECDQTTGFSNIDYNMYYNNGGSANLIDYGNTTYANLIAWQIAVSNFNTNSVEDEPSYLSPTDLHIIGCAVDGLGDNSAGVTDDIDGDARPWSGSTVVDMGADEIPTLSNDAGVRTILLANLCASSNIPLEVDIVNFGCNSIDSVDVHYTFNGSTTSQTIFVGLSSGESDTITVGSLSVPSSPSQFYEVKVWTSDPNNTADTDASNDTIENKYAVGLSGTYTLGGSNPDFADFASLSNRLDSAGLCGNTTIEVADGTYNESLRLNQLAGSGPSATLTIRGGDKANVTLAGSGALNHTVYLNGTDYVTIKNMTITHDGTSNAYGVFLTNATEHVTIDSCTIQVEMVTTSTVACIVASNSATSATSSGNNARYATISNSEIIGGYYGISLEGNNNSGVPTSARGNTVLNNEFRDQYLYGIYSDDNDSLSIIGNDIRDMVNGGSEAVYLNQPQDLSLIGNTLISADHGVYIIDLNFIGSGTAKVINNMIIGETDDGFEFDDVRNTDIFHNTIIGGRSGVHFDDYAGVDVRNNIFGSTSGIDHAFECDQTTGFTTIDHNIYYNNGGSANLIDYGNTTYQDLASWQTAVPAFNVNSIETEPVYVGVTDLHVLDSMAHDAGDSTVGVIDDIDGDKRPLAAGGQVDIGADEYELIYDDIAMIDVILEGICGDSNQVVWAVIYNRANDPQTGFDVDVEVNGTVTANLSATYTDTLFPFVTDTMMVGTANTYTGGTIPVTGVADLTNDQVSENDSVELEIEVVGIPDYTYDPYYFCQTDTVTLYAANPDLKNEWYADFADTVPVFVGDTFDVGFLSQSRRYYVQTTASIQSTVASFPPLNGGNGNNGITFNLEAGAEDVIVDSLATTPYASGILEVWYNPTAINGQPSIDTANGWIYVGQVSVTGQGSSGAPVLQVIEVPIGITIPAGATYGWYVGGTNVAYSNYAATAGDPFSDGNLTIHTGPGVGYGGSVQQNANRMFNGEIYYTIPGCVGPRNPYEVVALQSGPTAQITVSGSSPTFTFTPAATPGNSYAWDFGDGNSSTDEVPTHTYTQGGTFNVCLTVTNACGSDNTCTEVISYVGIDELSYAPWVNLYPNPVENGQLSIELNNMNGLVDVELFDPYGRTINVQSVDVIDTKIITLDVNSLSDGIYIVRVTSGDDIFNHKVLVQNK